MSHGHLGPMKRWGGSAKPWRSFAALIASTLSLSLVACGSISPPLPRGVEGAEAEQLADQLLSVVKAEAFFRAEGAQWRFRGTQYLWHRGLGRVRVTIDKTRLVYLDLRNQRGWVVEAGQRPSPEDEAE